MQVRDSQEPLGVWYVPSRWLDRDEPRLSFALARQRQHAGDEAHRTYTLCPWMQESNYISGCEQHGILEKSKLVQNSC